MAILDQPLRNVVFQNFVLFSVKHRQLLDRLYLWPLSYGFSGRKIPVTKLHFMNGIRQLIKLINFSPFYRRTQYIHSFFFSGSLEFEWLFVWRTCRFQTRHHFSTASRYVRLLQDRSETRINEWDERTRPLPLAPSHLQAPQGHRPSGFPGRPVLTSQQSFWCRCSRA